MDQHQVNVYPNRIGPLSGDRCHNRMNLDNVAGTDTLALEATKPLSGPPHIVVALLLALLAHLLVLGLVDWPDVDLSSDSPFSVLQVTLNRSPLARIEAPVGMDEPVEIEEKRRSSKSESRMATEDPRIESIDPATLDYEFLSEQIRSHARERATREARPKARLRQFSTADFPVKVAVKNEPSRWQRAFAPKRGRSQITSLNGFVTQKVTDSRGRVMCLQQRGDPVDRSTWLWHIVPGRLCGHLP